MTSVTSRAKRADRLQCATGYTNTYSSTYIGGGPIGSALQGTGDRVQGTGDMVQGTGDKYGTRICM